MTEEKLKCKFCNKEFIRPTSFEVHLCEKKKRFNEQNEPGVRLGFQSYLKFYESTQGNSKKKTFDDFSSSPYYKAFSKFGRYCVDIKAIQTTRFVEFLLKKNKKLDYWTSDSLYTEFLTNYLKVEPVSDALTRSMEFSIRWQESTGNPAHDLMRFGNRNVIVQGVMSGRLSPWAIFNSDSGHEFLSSLDSSQISIIWPYIDSTEWGKIFSSRKEDVEYSKSILKMAGW